MKIYIAIWTVVLAVVHACVAEKVDLIIVAGQSNAQGWRGDAAFYPKDPEGLDNKIGMYWYKPNRPKKGRGLYAVWTTLQAQPGRFAKGHFGPEITFAREMKKAGYNPAVFKCAIGSTSIADNWKGPGAGIYGSMVLALKKAVKALEDKGDEVNYAGFIWIQGESDGKNEQMAAAYKGRLKTLLDDLRKVCGKPDMKMILGVDEQHKWVKANPQIVKAQQELAAADKNIVYTSMIGLEKADATHLTPKGLEEHGLRLFKAYEEIARQE